jgi:hypothetical protein
MIKQTTKRIQCKESVAHTLPAYQLGGTWADGYLEFTVYTSNNPDLCMVHDDKYVLGIVDGDDSPVIESIYTLFEATTTAELQAEISRLDLTLKDGVALPGFLDIDEDGKPDTIIAGSIESGLLATEDSDSVNVLQDGQVTVIPKI